MLLLIDVGNTRLKWAVAAPDAAVVQASSPGAVAAGGTVPANIGDWIADAALLHAQIAGVGTTWAGYPVRQVLISNVAGAALAERVAAELAALTTIDGAAPSVTWFAAAAEVAGVRNGYRQPDKLGCDRLAALIGARALLPGRDLIVATCGTATTVDALRADGTFIGGMILPGLGTMARSLAQRTAQLPGLDELALAAAAPGAAPKGAAHAASQGALQAAPGAASAAGALFADHTEAAIRNGCIAAQAGAIERAIAALDDAFCLLSGGAAAWVSAALQAPHQVQDNLVLLGLQVVAQAHRPASLAAPVQSATAMPPSPPETNQSC